MDDDILTGEGSGEDDSLSETIAAALEDQQDGDLIAELGSAQDAAGETQETDGAALPDDDGGAETPGDGRTDQTEETESPPSAAREATDDGPERGQAAEAYQAAVAPFQAYLASKGVQPAQAVRILLAAEHQLSTGTTEQKARIFGKLAKDYGIDLYALADAEDAEPANPELTQIQQRIGSVERLIAVERQQAQTQLNQNAETQVMAFAEEKDTAGNTLHPHFADVRVVMGSLIAANLDLDVQTAYDNAVWANPNLRKSALTKQRAVPASKPGKLKRAKSAKEPSLRDMVTEAVRHDAERAGA